LDSVAYLAPERAQNSAVQDGRADIYSLGCTLYFLLAGHPPLLPPASLPDLHAEWPAVPADLAAICKKMMAERPEDRYQTAAEVSQALAQWRAASARSQHAATAAKGKAVGRIVRHGPHPNPLPAGEGTPCATVE